MPTPEQVKIFGDLRRLLSAYLSVIRPRRQMRFECEACAMHLNDFSWMDYASGRNPWRYFWLLASVTRQNETYA